MDNKAPLTEFNSNLATLQRIDISLRRCAVFSMNGDYYSWFKELEFLRKEACVKMDDQLMEKTRDTLREIQVKHLSRFIVRRREGKVDPDHRMWRDLRWKLDDYEVMLRQHMNERGMLLRDGDDERNALMG